MIDYCRPSSNWAIGKKYDDDNDDDDETLKLMFARSLQLFNCHERASGIRC